MTTLAVADRWYETRSLPDRVTLVRETHVSPDLRCNIWHLRGRDRDALVDTGLGLRPLRAEIAALAGREVLAIASHGHFDHIGGHHEFEHRLVHPAEAATLRDPDPRRTVLAEWDRPIELGALPAPGYSPDAFAIEPAPATRLIDEGDEIDLGDRVLRVFHMPGHSPGSLCLYEAATETFYTGDVIYDGELLDALHHSDRPRYVETLRRLRELPGRTFHCGHYESFGRERLHQLVDAYLEGRAQRT